MTPLPQPSGGFAWTQEPWGLGLRCAPLLSAAPHVFTTRELVLKGPPEAVDRGWAAVALSLGLGSDRLVRLTQVHGAEVFMRSAPMPAPDACPEADAAVSADRRVGVAVQTADCLPVLIADATGRAVAAVHAGWRGTAQRVAQAAVARLVAECGVERRALVAAIGPGIGPCCYEVGPEVAQAFLAQGHSAVDVERWFTPVAASREIEGHGTGGKQMLDLWRANHDLLLTAGLAAEHIHVARLCTATHVSLFCSYRVEREKAGRMAAAIRPGA